MCYVEKQKRKKNIWGGTIPGAVVKKNDCGNWLARGYMPAHQHCEICCERCLLITESHKTPGHYRYLIWVLIYIPYTGLAVFSFANFLVLLCTLRFRIFKVRVLNASE